MPKPYIQDLGQRRTPENIGNKAQKLRFLMQERLPTPPAYVCTWDAYQEYLDSGAQILVVLRTELEAILEPGRRYAVRSSANLEDNLDFSFAGQFKSILDAQGSDEVLHSIESVWASTRSSSVQSYLERTTLSQDHLHMAVLIQEMVPPQVSGVSFSRNPLTGMDEVVVEAVVGSGEALVQEGVTPDRWVQKWGTWISQPEDSAIDQDVIHQVVQGTKAIAGAYGQPVDLEWVYDGHTVHWVQLREMKLPDVPLYSNRISREVFPGLIKPLIWSVNVPLVNGAWIRLLTELIGPNNLRPEDLAGYFYYRAYFDMGTLGRIFEMLGFPRELLELLMGIEVEGPEKPSFRPTSRTYALLPKMARFAFDKLRFSRRLGEWLPELQKQCEAHHARDVESLAEREILAGIDKLHTTVQHIAYCNIVAPLLMQAYNQLLKARLGRLGVDFESFDLTGDLEALRDFEPNVHLARLHEEYMALDEEAQARILAGGYGGAGDLGGAAGLVQGIQRFLQKFGHLSDSGNDFSSVPWRENPDLVVSMVVNYHPPRPAAAETVRFDDLRAAGLQRWLLKWTYERARQYRLHREAVGSLYTYGYGLFRIYFLALGKRLARRGILAERDDIFYLYEAEVRDIMEGQDAGGQVQSLVQNRKAELCEAGQITPPATIFGDTAPPVSPHTAKNLRGIATSRGHYTGPVKVLQGIQDFGKLEEGDVLVIPYSDVGWTPLFTRAGAVVAQSGGILSHSSIVAREYGIPAVVSVPGACQLQDGTQVTVDGYQGEVIVHELGTDTSPSP
ncbi:MAG: PEP/pyruvate-binding domain-containing protein [Anaerolineae bacterium]